MPRYDYECDTCHNVFELRQGFDADTVQPCPECTNPSRRKFHAVPVVFKGSGWYVNDYGKRGGATSGSGENKEKSENTASKESSSDSGSSSDSKTSSDSTATSTSASSSSSE